MQHAGSLVSACGIQLPDQGSNLRPLCWERGVLATGWPGKPQVAFLKRIQAERDAKEQPSSGCAGQAGQVQQPEPQGAAGFALASTLSSPARHSRCLPGSNLSKPLSVCPSSRVQGPFGPAGSHPQAACTRPSSLALKTGQAC